MEIQTVIKPDLSESDFLKESELISRAAFRADILPLKQSDKRFYNSRFRSRVIETFNLDEGFLIALKNAGFSFEPGIKPPHDTMIYLSGNSHQEDQETFYSDCWAWERGKTDHQLTISFNLWVEEDKRGVVCEPEVWGNCSGGACHRPTINKFVAVVANHFPNVHPLIKQAADDGCQAIIYWSDIGLGGIKSIDRLFRELYGRNEVIIRLADSILSPFTPNPNRATRGLGSGDKFFVLESDQPRLFRQWRGQLQELRSKLT